MFISLVSKMEYKIFLKPTKRSIFIFLILLFIWSYVPSIPIEFKLNCADYVGLGYRCDTTVSYYSFFRYLSSKSTMSNLGIVVEKQAFLLSIIGMVILFFISILINIGPIKIISARSKTSYTDMRVSLKSSFKPKLFSVLIALILTITLIIYLKNRPLLCPAFCPESYDWSIEKNCRYPKILPECCPSGCLSFTGFVMQIVSLILLPFLFIYAIVSFLIYIYFKLK